MSEPTTTQPNDVGDAALSAPIKATKARPRPAKGSATIRHHVELTLRVAAMNEATRTLLAAASYAPSADVVDVVIETLVNEASVRVVVQALSHVVNADPMEAGVQATVLAADEKGTFKSAWRVLGALIAPDASGPQLPAQIPPASATAGMAFARAAQGLDEGARKLLAKLVKDIAK